MKLFLFQIWNKSLMNGIKFGQPNGYVMIGTP